MRRPVKAITKPPGYWNTARTRAAMGHKVVLAWREEKK